MYESQASLVFYRNANAAWLASVYINSGRLPFSGKPIGLSTPYNAPALRLLGKRHVRLASFHWIIYAVNTRPLNLRIMFSFYFSLTSRRSLKPVIFCALSDAQPSRGFSIKYLVIVLNSYNKVPGTSLCTTFKWPFHDFLPHRYLRRERWQYKSDVLAYLLTRVILLV